MRDAAHTVSRPTAMTIYHSIGPPKAFYDRTSGPRACCLSVTCYITSSLLPFRCMLHVTCYMLHVTRYMLHYLEDVAGARARVRRVREEATAALQKRRRDVNVLAREVIEARL